MGGNVFNKTGRIKRENIQPTLNMFYSQLGSIFPGAKKYFKDIKPLGSVGKKEYSGDIDLAMDTTSLMKLEEWGLDKQEVVELYKKFKARSRTSTKRQIIKRAILESISQKIQDSNTDIDIDNKSTSSGTLFFAFPQFDENNKPLDVGVQIDINFGNTNWLEFSYHSAAYSGNLKGLHRTQLLVSLFSKKGYTFSHNYGVKDKESQEIVANTPQKAIQVLSKAYGVDFDLDTLSEYGKLISFIKKNLSKEDLERVLDSYLKILDSTRADIPTDLQLYWINNQERLGLTGKFLPDDSNLQAYTS